MSKTIGVIGLGSIGMRHAKNLKAMGHNVIGFDPVLVGDGFASIWPVKRTGELDAVVLALPSNQHCVEVLESPAHVPLFVEKPIGVCRGDLEAFTEEQLLKIKMVGYNLRFHGCVKKAKEWLDSGKIGDPIWANFTLGQHSEKPPYLRDGVILNWSHEIDLALYLLGAAKVEGSSTLLRDGKDTMTDILLTHKGGGCRTTVHLDYITHPEQRYFSITGAGGRIDVDVAGFGAYVTKGDQFDEFYATQKDWNQTYLEEMQAFLDRIDGMETIGCTGEGGLEVLKICLEVRKQAGLT